MTGGPPLHIRRITSIVKICQMLGPDTGLMELLVRRIVQKSGQHSLPLRHLPIHRKFPPYLSRISITLNITSLPVKRQVHSGIRRKTSGTELSCTFYIVSSLRDMAFSPHRDSAPAQHTFFQSLFRLCSLAVYILHPACPLSDPFSFLQFIPKGEHIYHFPTAHFYLLSLTFIVVMMHGLQNFPSTSSVRSLMLDVLIQGWQAKYSSSSTSSSIKSWTYFPGQRSDP